MPRLDPLIRCQVGGVSLELRGDSPAALGPLRERWSLLAPSCEPPDLTFEVCLSDRVKRLSKNGKPRYESRRREDVWDVLEVDLYREVVSRSRSAPLHGAGLVIEGRALLLLGESDSGKSSLCLELLERGASYMGDEHVFVGADASASGLPRAIHLSGAEGGAAPLEHLPRREQVTLRAQPVALVVLLGRPRSPHAELAWVTGAKATTRLMESLHRRPTRPDLEALANLAAQAPVGELAREGVASAADEILAALRRRGAEGRINVR